MRISILHVSDIHFGIDDPDDEHPRITSGVIDAIEKNSITYDFVVFTGDLAQRALPSEFQQGYEWLNRLAEKSTYGVILCPGNHDVDWEKAVSEELRSGYSSDSNFNNKKKKIY